MSTAPEDFINGVNVTKAFQSLKLKSSSGPDGLSNLPLKYAAKELSAVFIDMFQLSINTGVLPDSWRTTRISPLLIACSPVSQRIFESLVALLRNDQVTHAILDAVSCLTHAINAHLDKGCKAVFHDLSIHLIHCHVKGYSTSSLPQISRNG